MDEKYIFFYIHRNGSLIVDSKADFYGDTKLEEAGSSVVNKLNNTGANFIFTDSEGLLQNFTSGNNFYPIM